MRLNSCSLYVYVCVCQQFSVPHEILCEATHDTLSELLKAALHVQHIAALDTAHFDIPRFGGQVPQLVLALVAKGVFFPLYEHLEHVFSVFFIVFRQPRNNRNTRVCQECDGCC